MTAPLRVLRKLAAVFGIALCVAVTTTAGSLLVTTEAAAQSSTIVVEGNRRVDAETIRSYFGKGPYTAAKVDEAWKALYATGLFSDVQISQSGGRIIVRVSENEVINKVAFEGNTKVKDEVLAGEVQSKPRGTLSKATVQADTQRIIEVYHHSGRYDVRVNPVTIDRGNGRVDLVFEIKEGDKAGVKDIKFVGNKAFSDWKLKDVISTTTTNWLSFLKSTDVYDADRVNSDQELLRRFYLKNGYADFRIISATAEMAPGGGGFIITFTLDEGDQYRFGKVDVVSNIRDVSAESLRGVVRAHEGDIYNAEMVEKTVENLTIEVSKSGYAFAQVRPRGDRDFATKRINVVFVVEEGPRVYIERIEIRGNTRTRDWVIRREFDLGEGDAYNRVLVDRAERRLRNLGYFKSVKITNEPGSAPDRVILVVSVEDQPTGEFSVSGGYSTADGIIGEVSLGEKNFLGRGQYVKVSGSFGQNTQGAEFSFTEPYFLGYRVAAGVDLYWKQNQATSYTAYDSNIAGGGFRLGLPITDEVTLALRYNLYSRELSICDGYSVGTILYNTCAQDISWAIRDAVAQGQTITSVAGYTLSFNGLDNNLNPTQGLYMEFKQDFAGLGGDVNFIRTTGDIRHYTPMWGDSVLLLRAQAGYVQAWGSDDLDIMDNFFMGPNLVRGFAPSGIGPRDLAPCATSNAGTIPWANCVNGTTNALGGTTYWGVSAELQFPLSFLPKDIGMKAALFADAGSLWNYGGPTSFPNVPNWNGNNIYGNPNFVSCAGLGAKNAAGNVCAVDQDVVRSSVGASLIWQSPFGPLRFDYAWVLSKATYDQTQAFRFSGGTRF